MKRVFAGLLAAILALACLTALAEKGANYPNVLLPEGNPIFSQAVGFPRSCYVDGEGVILTNPIVCAAPDRHESVLDKLLAGERVTEAPEASAIPNDGGQYRVYVFDQNGVPVEGALIQFCDDATCTFQPTDANGIATFDAAAQKVYDVHVLQAPEGFKQNTVEYKTLDTFSDVTIILERE